ncbi:MAG TPA: FAD-dependent monooxygenase [Burkholderiales bacterium]|jgi:3-(3-hydroxy-phenyl)propionate hydroxylase|nr:FAD-dependent monooxygenase [Burkholderiales bacterium]
MEVRNIVVVGAGPVGTVAALACARFGHNVTLLESQEKVNDAPRASTTQPPTLEILAELGLIDEYIAKGLVAPTFQFWDRGTLKLVAEFDFDRLRDETPYPYVVQTEQHKLALMGIERLRAMGATVRMSTRVTGLTQDERSVTVETEQGPVAADYVIGCDGGRSTVRKSLGIEFEGFTWPERFLVITTPFDFATALGCCYRNYMADPDEWTNLFKVAGDDLKGRWRAVYNTRQDESDEEALSDPSVRARLGRIYVPEGKREYFHLNLYNVHQRVAKQFRKGRVFLCGDAAHVNNPIGGLGLNSGIHEAWHLAKLLNGGDLDEYERVRRPLNIEYVQEQTIANKKRLEEREPAARQKRFDELKRMADDPLKHKGFLMRASLLETWKGKR